MKDVKFMEYRMSKLVSNIEFLGGFCQLSKDEKEEYERLREYFVKLNNIEGIQNNWYYYIYISDLYLISFYVFMISILWMYYNRKKHRSCYLSSMFLPNVIYSKS